MRRLALLTLVACGGSSSEPQGLPKCEAPVNGTTITTRMIGDVEAAMLATSPPNDLRLFVVEQRGSIRIFTSETLLPDRFLDLSQDAGGPVVAGGELGLLGLAFHPKYADNRTFFIYYTSRPGGSLKNVVARCLASEADPNQADPASCVEILVIDDFAGNHNGGMLEFNPKDKFLYIGTGDGGGGGDPQRTGQNTNSLLGKILRIDVDKRADGKEYGIPSDNPFATGGGLPEIYMLGLRNPWRFSFDRETGDFWVADVGQNIFEELTVVRPPQQNGANFGWSIYEGNSCCQTQGDRCGQSGPQAPCNPAGLVFPQEVRTHNTGWVSITGGQVYRGTCYPDIVGWYFYTDYGKGGLVRARLLSDDTLDVAELPGSFPGSVASIHDDARGELYLTTTSGGVYHLEAGP